MTERRWDELRKPFERLVLRAGVRNVADKLPAHRATVYRLLNDEQQKPCRAIRAAVQRLVEREDSDG